MCKTWIAKTESKVCNWRCRKFTLTQEETDLGFFVTTQLPCHWDLCLVSFLFWSLSVITWDCSDSNHANQVQERRANHLSSPAGKIVFENPKETLRADLFRIQILRHTFLTFFFIFVINITINQALCQWSV